MTGVLAVDDPAALKAAAATFDAVADTVGGAVAISTVALIRPGGRFATVVPPPPPAPEGISAKPHFMSPDMKILRRLVNLLAAGKLQMPKIQTLPLAQPAEAHRLVESHRAAKVVMLVE